MKHPEMMSNKLNSSFDVTFMLLPPAWNKMQKNELAELYINVSLNNISIIRYIIRLLLLKASTPHLLFTRVFID